MKSWETTQRLQKVLDEKKKKQAREAEKLRQEVGVLSKSSKWAMSQSLLHQQIPSSHGV